ncbi:MAG: metallophosphoesterase [Asgard group archaeon]
MRIAVISDIHSNLHALCAVLAEMRKAKVDGVLCCGDIVGYGAYPNECIEMIENITVGVLQGNHDRAIITSDYYGFNPMATEALLWTEKVLKKESLDWLESLPYVRVEVEMGGINFTVAHGSPLDPDEYIFPSERPPRRLELYLAQMESDFILIGHTHIPYVWQCEHGIILNPGAVGQPRDFDPRASFALIDKEEDHKVKIDIVRVDYDIQAAARAIIEKELPEFLAKRLFLGE